MKPNGGGDKIPSDKLERRSSRTSRLRRQDEGRLHPAPASPSSALAGPGSRSRTARSSASTKTANGEGPLVHGGTPILGCDVWEHSYYIDYRNRRPDYLKAFLDQLVNWDYVAELFDKTGA